MKKRKLVLTDQEIQAFYRRFCKEHKTNESITSSIRFASFGRLSSKKFFDVEIDNVYVILRAHDFENAVQTYEGFVSLINSGVIKIYKHEKIDEHSLV